VARARRVGRERTQQVQQLSCDTERLEVWAVEFLPNGSKLNQAMADGSGSISMFVYDREVRVGLCVCVGGGVQGLARQRPCALAQVSGRRALLRAPAQNDTGRSCANRDCVTLSLSLSLSLSHTHTHGRARAAPHAHTHTRAGL
jgi:hypothetical protein